MKVVSDIRARRQGGIPAEATIEFLELPVSTSGAKHEFVVLGAVPRHFVLQSGEHAAPEDAPSGLALGKWAAGTEEGAILLPLGTVRPKPKKNTTRAQRAVLINSAKLRVATEKNPPRWIVNLAQKTP